MDRRGSFPRSTPSKHEDDRSTNDRERGYSNHSSRQRSSLTSPTGSFSYSSLGDPGSAGRFGHYGHGARETHGHTSHSGHNAHSSSHSHGNSHSGTHSRSSYRTSRANSTWETPSHKDKLKKEREMLSIYGRGSPAEEDEYDSLPSNKSSTHTTHTTHAQSGAMKKKYHNPCRFQGHDHEWRDCPNNYRNKKRKYKEECVIGKSTSWGGDYYGPASEGGGGGGSGNNNVSGGNNIGGGGGQERHESNSRGYNSKHDLRSKSFGAEPTRSMDDDSAAGTVDSDQPSPRGRHYRGGDRNYYSPAGKKNSPEQTNERVHERGYSSASFGSLSASRRGSVQINPSIPVPPFHRSYSYDDYKREGEDDTNVNVNQNEVGDSSFYRRLALASSRDAEDSNVELRKEQNVFMQRGDGRGASSGNEIQSNSNYSVELEQKKEEHVAVAGSKEEKQPVQMASSKLDAHESVTAAPSEPQSLPKAPLQQQSLPKAHTALPSLSKAPATVASQHLPKAPLAPQPLQKVQPTTKPQPATKEEPKKPSLTCAALGIPEKVTKAEDVVSKMNALMNKPPTSQPVIKSEVPTESTVPLPSKNEILKCMAVIDTKIKCKDDDAASIKKEIKELEQHQVLQEEKLSKQHDDDVQLLTDEVAKRKVEREGSVQLKDGGLAKVIEEQKVSIQKGLEEELIQLRKECAEALKVNTATCKAEMNLVQKSVDEAELAIEDLNAPPSPKKEEQFVIDESEFVPTMDAPGKITALISSIYQDNQRIAAEAHHDSLAAIPYFPQSEDELKATRNSPTSVITNEQWSNRARKVTGLENALYTQPSEVPMYNENNASFVENAPQLLSCLKQKKKKLKKRWEDLATQYLVRQEIFNAETGHTDTSERGGFFSITARVDESGEIQPLGGTRGNNPYRRPRRGVSPGDVVRSEYEQEQIIAEIAAKEAMEKRIREGGCALPRQRGMLENTLFASFSNAFLANRVEDYMEDEAERRHINVWTDMEKCIFFDRFLHHPKDFRKISSFLRNKTTKDCIEFYYNSKKTIPYKHALKEFLQRKKRQGSVIGWDATIQAALSVGATIKPGESPEKPLKFILPQSDHTFRTHSFHPMQMEVFNNLETVALQAKNHEEVKSKPKRSNWFILDAPSRKYIKHHKDEKEHSSKRKSAKLTEEEVEKEEATPAAETEPKKVQRVAEMTDVHGNEEKKAAKANKWKAEEKKLFFEAVEKFGHNWSKVSEHVGTRTVSQVKNYFYDSKKQVSKKKDKGEKTSKAAVETAPEPESKKKNAKEKKSTAAKQEKGSGNASDDANATNKPVKEDIKPSPQPNPAKDNTNSDAGLCMPVDNQSEQITSAEEQYRQQLLLDQRYIQMQQAQMQQHHQQQHQQQQHHHMQQQQQQQQEIMHERFLQQQMQRMHDAQRLQEAQRMEDARQRHQEEMIRQQQQHQQQQQHWLAQFQQQQQQQQHQHNRHHQGNEWVDRQQLHNIQSLLALRQQEQSPMTQSNYSVHQSNMQSGSGYQSSNNSQASDMERMFQSRMAAVAAAAAAGIPQTSLEAALARQGNDNQSQHQHAANLELYHRLQGDGRSYGGGNNGYPHYHQGGR